MATATEQPHTFSDAQVYLAGLWPGSGAQPKKLAEFYESASEVYASAAKADTAHRRKALWWAEESRKLATQYTQQFQGGEITAPSVVTELPKSGASQ